ncbi:MAG: ribonuclease E/G [Pseudomonadota bacterium]
MKGKQAILGHLGPYPIALRYVDGVLDDVLVPDMVAPALGSIYRGIVDRPQKGMGGVMVKLPDGAMGFLRGAKGLTPGDVLTVQMSGYAEPGKAVPLTARPLFKSRYVIVTPHAPGVNVSRQIRDEDIRDALQVAGKASISDNGFGLIFRSAAAAAEMDDVLDDLDTMMARADAVMAETGKTPELLLEGDDPHVLAWREWADVTHVLTGPDDLDQTGALDDLVSLTGAEAPLPHGSLFIEPTRALVAVDVNTGPHTALDANLDAIHDLPRHLRLRGLGGQITVDLAPVMKRDRKLLETKIKSALRGCPVETEFVGWTPLGHIELKRKRERAPVAPILKGL